MGSEKSDEDMELPQATERVIPLENVCGKKETQVVVIGETAKEDNNPVVLSRDPLNLDDDEMEEVEQKVCFNPNLRASSSVVFVQHHWCKYSQVQRGVKKPARKLPYNQRIVVMRKRPTMRKKVRLKSRMNDIDSPELQNSVFRRLAKPKVTIHGDSYYEENS
ncbi:splicing factor 3B subunit 2 [Trichonephila clavipes]|nr:splicing factor 3B subunit 2 [Trichonephila clavipes]